MSVRIVVRTLLAIVLLVGLLAPFATAQDQPSVEKPKEPDEAPGPGYSPLAVGGPDIFGYTYRDSAQSDGPAYDWVEIAGTGTVVLLGDDDYDGPFPIDFSFNFYGIDYTDFYIGSNGFLSFGSGSTDLTNSCPLPSTDTPHNLIALMWDDLDPGDTSDPVYYQSFAAGACPYPGYAGACLVVQYEDFCLFPGSATCDIAGTFEAILFDNHYILLQYEDAGAEEGLYSTTGLENQDASDGLTYVCDTAGSLRDGRAVEFYYPGPDLAASRKAATAAVELSDRIDYAVELVNTGNQAAADATLTDPLPEGTTFVPGSLACSSGTCWYQAGNRTVRWSGEASRAPLDGARPTPGRLLTPAGASREARAPTANLKDMPHDVIPGSAPPGTVLENFANTWSGSTLGLVYDPGRDLVRYAHEIQPAATVYDVDYPVPHNLLDSISLSAVNAGWPVSLDNRDGVGYDSSTDTYFLPDYNGDLSIADDNIVEIDPAGTILNAWETDGAGNDSYNGSAINPIVDIAVVPGTPARYFATAAEGRSVAYEIDLVKTGTLWTPLSWGTVQTCTVPGLADNWGIDYDAEHGLLYHSDRNSTNIVVTDLACHVVDAFTCASANGFNTGVTYVEGKIEPEIWVTDFGSETTTRCAASASAPCDRTVSLFSDDFEAGLGDWTLTGLWNEEHEADTCGSLVAPFPSSDTGAYFGLDATCTYSTGLQVTGTLELGLDVDLNGYSHAALNFWSFEQTECGGLCTWDRRYVDVSTDGGDTWATVWASTGPEGAWYQASANLWDYTGGPLRVRFRFDSIDGMGNGYFGWLVDNVEVVACPVPVQLAFAVEAPEWCGSVVNEAVVTDPEAGPVALQATTYVAEDLYQLWDFEIDGGGFARSLPGEWEWGMPAYPLGLTAHSGRYVWGVDLHGDADDTVGHHRLSRSVSLPNHPNGVFLSWWDWYGAEASDCTNVYVDGTLIYGSCDRNQRQWTHHVVNLSAWAGQTVDLEFDLEVCCSDPGPDGWYIDDVAIHSGCIPDIEVDAPPLDVSLCTDEVRTLEFSICNDDNLPLEWRLNETTGVAALGQAGPSPEAGNWTPPAAGFQSDRVGEDHKEGAAEPEVQAGPRSIVPKAPQFVGRVLWDDTHDDDGDDLFINYLDLYNALTLAGYDVVQFDSGPIDSAALALYDILVIVDAELAFDPGEITAIQNWVAGGHGLLAIGERQVAFNFGTYNDLLAPYGIQHGSDSGDSVMTDITAHALAQGVTQVTGDGWGGLTVVAPAVDLIRDSAGLPVLAANESYRVVDITDSNLMDDSYYATTDNAVLMENIFAWLLEAGVDVPWLAEAPAAGRVLPGECADVEVTFDAAGLPIDDYAAELVLWSNDPDTPAIHLPVTMHVTCAAHIYLPLIVKN